MAAVPSTRPSSTFSDLEVVLELFRAARNFQLTTAAQLVNECKKLFPDLPAARRAVCFGKLADMLEKDQ